MMRHRCDVKFRRHNRLPRDTDWLLSLIADLAASRSEWHERADIVEKLENSIAKFFRQNRLNHPNPRRQVSISREDHSHCRVSVPADPLANFPAGFSWAIFLANFAKIGVFQHYRLFAAVRCIFRQ